MDKNFVVTKPLIGGAFTNAIKELTKLHDTGGSENIEKIVVLLHKTPTIKAFLLLYKVGDEAALKAMRVFPCTPSKCAMGESMEAFLGKIAGVADLVDSGKMTEHALSRMNEVFKELGHIPKAKTVEDIETATLNRARGAAGVITVLDKITDANGLNKVIDDFEVKEEILDAFGNRIADRIMDITTTDVTKIEVKGWKDKAKSLEYLLGKLDDEGGRVGNLSAQLFNDIVQKALNPEDKRIWVFADDAMEALKPELVEAVVDRIADDPELLRKFMSALGGENYTGFVQSFVGNETLDNIVSAIMRIN